MRTLTLATRSYPVTLDEAVSRFTRRCEAKNLSPGTIAYYGFHLTALSRYLASKDAHLLPADITTDTLRGFLSERMKVSAVTAHHSLLTARVFFRFLEQEDITPTNPAAGLDGVRRKKPLIPTFSPEQVQAVLEGCNGRTFNDVRDRAIILLLLDTGLRASEVCGVLVDAIDWHEQTLTVWGKGAKQRLVPFGEAARQALQAYLDRRGDLDTPQVFVSNLGDPLSRRRVLEIIHERCANANVKGVRCSPHTFRHTFAVMYLRNGGDVFSLQKILGHSDLAMTRRYAELSQTDVLDRHRTCSPGDRFIGAVKPVETRKRIK
jgi:integrase/recombinase XerD